MMKLQGKVAVITGASMGIGEAIARLFAQEGARLVLCSRDLARTEAARQRIGAGENAIALACDVSRRDQVESMVRSGLRQFGRIDILVNNAGFGLNDSVEQIDISKLRLMFDTNYFGALECMQAVIPVMRQQGRGDIVNISSVAAYISTPYMSGYAATKHAMNALSKAGRIELMRDNINVLAVCPGFIATNFNQNMVRGKDAQRVSQAMRYAVGPEVVAKATLRAMLKRKREVVVPRFYTPLIKLYQNFPGLIERAMRRSLRPTHEVVGERAGKAQKSA
jgi:uncharacterized protein